MSNLDNEAHNPLDWAADSGDVNVMEFFIRKGLSPFRVDALNRTPLYWAVKNGRVAAARYLVKCGCDPYQLDSVGSSPMKIALESGNTVLVEALKLFKASNAVDPHTVELANSAASPTLDSTSSPALYTLVGQYKKSHAIYLKDRSRVSIALIFGTIVFLCWALAVVVPFYGWAAIMLVALACYRRANQTLTLDKYSNQSSLPLPANTTNSNNGRTAENPRVGQRQNSNNLDPQSNKTNKFIKVFEYLISFLVVNLLIHQLKRTFDHRNCWTHQKKVLVYGLDHLFSMQYF